MKSFYVLVAALLSLAPPFAASLQAQSPQTFNYTGAEQTFTVPSGVSMVHVIAFAATGGAGNSGSAVGAGGKGGKVEADLAVTPGQILYLYVGGKGIQGGAGGFNGGGGPGTNFGNGAATSGGGGGATDIRIGGNALSNRVLVAGGGGGAGAYSTFTGGNGGGLTGGNGSGYTAGTGGSQGAGGNSGGALGLGGSGTNASGGGGGYYGGGYASAFNGGSGGGSSYTDPTLCSNVVHTQGASNPNSDGVITLSWTASTCPPIAYDITGGGGYCIGGVGVEVGLAGSESGVSYQLQLDGSDISSPVNGDGNAISFGNQMGLGTYTVVATNTGGNCTADMTNSVSVGLYEEPGIFSLIGYGPLCAGGTARVGLDGTDEGVTYEFFRDNAPTGSSMTGSNTGEQTLNFGTAGTYTIKATVIATQCTADMDGSFMLTEIPSPTKFQVSGGGGCSGSEAITLSSSELDFNYQLQLDGMDEGNPFGGTEMSLNWGIQSAPGTYTVVATSPNGCTATMMGNAIVAEPSTPFGQTWYEHVTGITAYSDFNWAGIAYGNGKIVAVLNHYTFPGGQIFTSTDGIQWTQQTPATNNIYGFNDVIFANGQFMAVGQSVVETSPDGITWTAHNPGTTNRYEGLTFGNDTWLIVGSNGALSKSTDNGVTWTGVSTPAGVNWISAAFGNGVFVIGGLGNAMFSSTDLVTWTRWDLYSFAYKGIYVAYGDGKFVAVQGSEGGGIFTSTNGINWTAQNSGTTDWLNQIDYLNGQFLVSDGYTDPLTPGDVLTSTDGICWANKPTGFNYGFTSIAYDAQNGIYAAVSGDGKIYSTLCHTPVVFELTALNQCVEGLGGSIELSGSEINYLYQLKKGGNPVGSPLPGTGNALTFSGITESGDYTVTATSLTGGCTEDMNGTASTIDGELPIITPLSGTNCPGATINLSATSPSGKNVMWYDAATSGNLLGEVGDGENFSVQPQHTTTYYAQLLSNPSGSATFNFTGSVQTFTVPDRVTSLRVTAVGAGGSDGYEEAAPPGEGGKVVTELAVTPGQVLNIYVGGLPSGEYEEIGGYNGGGSSPAQYYGAGGGATDIRIGGTALSNRVIVAGGGGGAGYEENDGGDGGGLVGQKGDDDYYYPSDARGGGGGTQSMGGAGGYGAYGSGLSGTLGQGGNGPDSYYSSGGGGGGYYGGGGGGDYDGYSGGGGGGSSYTDPTLCTNVVHTQGGNPSAGYAIISYGDGTCISTDRVGVAVDVITMSISADQISAADCKNTTCNTDDTFTADITVTYTSKPASGTLSLTGPTVVGTVPAVSVASIGATSYTFTGVTLYADGEEFEMTATFSEGCAFNADELEYAPSCQPEYVPTNITVAGFGCLGPNGTYTPAGTLNGAPKWESAYGPGNFRIVWTGSQWEIQEAIASPYAWAANSSGFISNLPCSGNWTDPLNVGCIASPITLTGGCGSLVPPASPACDITDISLSSVSGCNDNNSTPASDDYFTANVTVTFAYAPAHMSLRLLQGNTELTYTSDDLSCTTTHTFIGVQLPANGQPVVLTAEFFEVNRSASPPSPQNNCTYTSGTLMNAPSSCSCVATSAFSSCPSTQAVNVATGSCANIVTYNAVANGTPAPTYAYEFTGATSSTGTGTGSGASFNKGATLVKITANNDCGSAMCQFTVTVTDNIPPTLTACPANVSVDAASGQCGNTATWIAPTANDNCSGVQISSTHAPGASFLSGTSAVTYTATDAAGLTAACSFNVQVGDKQNPSIVCPQNIVRNTDPNKCAAAVSYTTPTFSDNCVGPTLSRTGGLASGADFPKGINMVEWQATDAVGNSAICQFTVTVNDALPPSITCPSNIVRSAGTGLCSAMVTYANPTASDNCGTPTVTLHSATGTASGSQFPIGATTVVWKASDANSPANTATCMFTVTVNDTQQPSISCPSNQTVNNTPGSCSAVVNYTTPSYSDNCTGGGAAIQSGLSSGSNFPKGINTVVWKATDAAGLTKTCSFRVTVNDTEAPAIACPTVAPATAAANACNAVVVYSTPTATDNCPGTPTVTRLSGPVSGSTFSLGVTSVVWRAVDGAGRSSTCSFAVTVTDATPPAINCPNSLSVTGNGNPCTAVATYTVPTATDNCGVQSVFLLSGQPSGSSFPAGPTVNTWRAVDNSGKSATCSFTVTVGCGASPDPSEGGENVAVERDVERAISSPSLRGGRERLGLFVSPNPATSEVQISIENLSEAGGELTVLNAQGRLMWQQSKVQHPTSTVSLEGFAAGLYFVTLRSADGQMTTKRLMVSRL